MKSVLVASQLFLQSLQVTIVGVGWGACTILRVEVQVQLSEAASLVPLLHGSQLSKQTHVSRPFIVYLLRTPRLKFVNCVG